MSLKLLDPLEKEFQATVEAFRAGCQLVSERIQGGERINRIALHYACYGDLRESLPSHMAQTCIRNVVGGWKTWKANGRRGRPPTYSRRVACYQEGQDWSLLSDRVSIRTLGHRVKLAYQVSPQGHQRLAHARESGGLGGARLVKRRKGWFLDITVKLPDPPTYEPFTPIGIDRGIAAMAVARAPGMRPLFVRGNRIKHFREYYLNIRQRLQRKGTRSARRALKRLSAREKRFVLNEARVTARRICDYALAFERPVLVLEALGGIRQRWHRAGFPKKGRRFRGLLSAWAYGILQKCIGAAAEELGIPYVQVNPAWTSRTCPGCGDAREENRRRTRFLCHHCGYRNHADVVGATNLARLWLHQHAGQPWGPSTSHMGEDPFCPTLKPNLGSLTLEIRERLT